MKWKFKYLKIIFLCVSLNGLAVYGESPAVNLKISKAGELIFEEMGKAPLDNKSRFYHGKWEFVEDGMLGTQDEPHLATIRIDRDFNDVIFQFDIKFLDPGRMFFCSWNKDKGGHSMDAEIDQINGQMKIIKADLDGKKGPDKQAVLAKGKGDKIKLNQWYTCVIEQKGVKAALHFNGTVIEGVHEKLLVPKFNFFINVGGKQHTEKTMIRNIKLWKAL